MGSDGGGKDNIPRLKGTPPTNEQAALGFLYAVPPVVIDNKRSCVFLLYAAGALFFCLTSESWGIKGEQNVDLLWTKGDDEYTNRIR